MNINAPLALAVGEGRECLLVPDSGHEARRDRC